MSELIKKLQAAKDTYFAVDIDHTSYNKGISAAIIIIREHEAACKQGLQVEVADVLNCLAGALQSRHESQALDGTLSYWYSIKITEENYNKFRKLLQCEASK